MWNCLLGHTGGKSSHGLSVDTAAAAVEEINIIIVSGRELNVGTNYDVWQWNWTYGQKGVVICCYYCRCREENHHHHYH